MSAQYFAPLLQEALDANDPDDAAQGVVALRAAGVTYIGYIVQVPDDGSGATVLCVDRQGGPAPYPVHVAGDSIDALRYADLTEAPHTNFRESNGPV